MNRLIIALFLFGFMAGAVRAQHSLELANPELLFKQGKELFVQRKYAASYRNFEQYLSAIAKTDAGQQQEAEYYMAANACELRRDNAEQLLDDYLKAHPYSPFVNQTNFMLGSLQYEKRNYRKALQYYQQVNEKALDKKQSADFNFQKGYSLVESADYQQAASVLRKQRDEETRYKISAIYYYAYSLYMMNKYDAALSDFLRVENSEQFKNIVPYYIIQIYYHQNNSEKVTQYAENLLAKNPKNPNYGVIYRILGETAYSKSDYTKTVQNLKKYEELTPKLLRNDMYILGLSLYNTEQYTDAIKYLQKTTTQNDELSENAYLHLGNTYLKLGDKSNARMAYEAALRSKFNVAVREEAMYNYALTAYDTNSAFGESVSAFENFIAEFPSSKYVEKAKNYMAEEFFTTKNYEEAIAALDKIKNPTKRLVEARQYILYQIGIQYFQKGNQSQAIENFSLAIDVSSITKYACESYFWRSEAYSRAKLTDKSIDDLKSFFANSNASKSTNYPRANYSMAYACFQQKKYSEALGWFVKYTQTEKDKKSNTYADALNRVGDCYFNARNFEKAENYYRQAASASPNTGDYASFQIAYVAGLKNNYALKIERLKKLIESYPKSEYADDALYETGRAYLMLEQDDNALTAYRQLISEKPNSNLVRKAALEMGMIYFNRKDYEEAIAAYKSVIKKYAGSEEAYTALQSLETLYIEKNDVDAFIAYAKTINLKTSSATTAHADSLTYIAAERQYINGGYQNAITGFLSYLKNYCAGGRYCTMAQYYLADSYYRLADKQNALTVFVSLARIQGSQYLKEAVSRCAEITYDNKDFGTSFGYFGKLDSLAESAAERDAARLGLLRCSYRLDNYSATIEIAGKITADAQSSAELLSEAHYNRAKAYLALRQNEKALNDLKALAADTRNENGAEAKYLLAQLYFDNKNATEAETEVLDFAKKNTPYRYWLARGFVLLADIYIQKNDDFQAKQYLLSLQKNYTTQDDIQEMIDTRLLDISGRENEKIIN